MRFQTSAITCFLLLAIPAIAAPVVVTSPSGNLKVTVTAGEDGRLTYSVTEGGTVVLQSSPLGVMVDGVALGDQVQLGKVQKRSISETYPLHGVHKQANHRANEAEISIVSQGRNWALQVHAEDAGFAFRYRLPAEAKHLDAEATTWRLAEPMTAAWQDFEPSYEGHDHATPWSGVPEGKRISGLLTVFTPKHVLLLSEANNANYPDFNLVRNGDAIQPQWYADAKGFDLNETRRTTPWRATVVARDLTGLANTDLFTNLCPPPDKAFNFSFVKPGRIVWQWCSIGEPKLDDQQDWYDAAAKLGWEYYMIDDGWRTWKKDGKDQWALLKDVIAYGKSKGIETIIWVDSKELIRSPQARRAYLEKVRDCGAVGIKIDFIPQASAGIMAWYDETLRETADLRLMTIFHGCVKPTGRVRTWPHALTSEGGRGNEYQMTRYNRLAPLDHDVVQPFTRFALGAGDVTPVVLDPKQLRGYTWPHMFAQGITTWSPLACFYDHWKFYVESPAADLFRELPVTWDETRVLACTQVGKTVAIARRKGKIWWIGIINGPEATKVDVKLDFLKGKTKAVLLRDGKEDASFDRQQTKLGPADTLVLDLRKGGGFVAKLEAE